MVVSSRDKVNRIANLHFSGDLFQTLSTESTFIIATKGVDCSFSRKDYGMKSSTGDFVDFELEEWVGYDTMLVILFSLFIFNVEVFDVSEADGTLGFTLTRRVVVLV